MNSLKDRLEWAMSQDWNAGKTDADLARAAGVKPPSIADWKSGDTKTLKAEPAIRAAMFLGVSPLWLACGAGSAIQGRALSARAIRVAELWSMCAPKAQTHIEGLLNTMQLGAQIPGAIESAARVPRDNSQTDYPKG